MDQKPKPLSQLAIDGLEQLAINLTFGFSAKDSILAELYSPATLTVAMPGKGYRKQAFVGGETFYFYRAKVGAASMGNRLIFILKPVDAAAYTEVEMTENEAHDLLGSFRAKMTQALGRDYMAAHTAIRKLDQEARAEETMKEKFDDYETFGSW